MYANAAAITLHVRRLAAVFALICAFSAFCYGVFLLLAVERTASLSTTEGQIQNLSSELSTLESNYLAAEQTLTPERAHELGFVVPPASSEAFAEAPSRALSLNDGRH